jgi:hypothetical protein
MDRFGGQYIPPGKRREMERQAAEAAEAERLGPPGKRRGMEQEPSSSSGIAARLGQSTGNSNRRQESSGIAGRLGPLKGDIQVDRRQESSGIAGRLGPLKGDIQVDRRQESSGIAGRLGPLKGDMQVDRRQESSGIAERLGPLGGGHSVFSSALSGLSMSRRNGESEKHHGSRDMDYSDRAGTHTLIVQNFRADMEEQQKGALLQPLLSVGGSVQWISPTECMIAYLNLGMIHRAISSKYNTSLAVTLLKDLGEKSLGYYDAATKLQEALERPESSSKVANRLIGHALGIRVRPSNTQHSLKKAEKHAEVVDAWDD